MMTATRKPTRTIVKTFRRGDGAETLQVVDYTGDKWRNDDTVRGRDSITTGRFRRDRPNMQNLPGTIANTVDKLAERGSLHFRNNFKRN